MSGAIERAHQGVLLQALYPLAGKVPGLERIPVAVRRSARRELTRLACRAHMLRCRQVAFIGITGSLGKTTTKDLLAEMLATRGATLKTRKNDNGLYGVPATLLAVHPDDRYAVVEVGIFDQPGEMSWMSSLFDPSIAILTSIGEDHVPSYGSKEAVAAEKRALLERVGSGGTVVINGDDPLARSTTEGLEARVVTAGRADDCNYRLLGTEMAWPDGIAVEIEALGERHRGIVPLYGTALAANVVLALAAAVEAGTDPGEAFAAARGFAPTDGRLKPAPGPRGSTWLLDDFKSRLTNQTLAIESLGAITGARRLAVLGEAQDCPLEHGWENAATLLPGRSEVVIAIGRHSELLRERLRNSGIQVSAHERWPEAAEALDATLEPGDVVLLHGAMRQHLRRIKLAVEGGTVGCRVKRCLLHMACGDCPHLGPGPPARLVEEY